MEPMRGSALELFATYLFLIPLVVGVLCECVKLLVETLRRGALAIDHFLQPGGFPSTHSAFVTSLLIIVWRRAGVESLEFAITSVFAALVWYDAMSSRRAIGEQAEVLNRLQHWRHLATPLGHSFLEVVGGIVFGAVVTMIGIWLT
jgi:acid phosphatase family membrane protein YuiD